MAEHLTKIKAEQGPAATMLERHRAISHENGVQRILGPQALLLRLGLVEKNAKGTMELCANTRLQPSPTSIAHCEELVAKLGQPWEPPQHASQCEAFISKVQSDVRSLGSWSGMGGTYICPHVVRKVAILAGTKVMSASRATLLAASPDERNHLDTIPASWDIKRIKRIAPDLPPSLFSMWTCLLGPVLREETRLQQVVMNADMQFAQRSRTTSQALRAELGVTPSPKQVFRRTLANMQEGDPALSRVAPKAKLAC